MSKHTIPERTVVTCDFCGNECSATTRRYEGVVRLERAGLDNYGHAVGSAGHVSDACDSCLDKADAALRALVTHRSAPDA